MRMNTDPKQRAGELVDVPEASVAPAVLGWLCAVVRCLNVYNNKFSIKNYAYYEYVVFR